MASSGQGETLQCRTRLQRAGHLLGSAYVECDVRQADMPNSTRVVFSGDLDAGHNPLLKPVRPPERAELLVLESTYGDRLHPDRSERRKCQIFCVRAGNGLPSGRP